MKIRELFAQQIHRNSPARHASACLLTLALWAALPADAQTKSFGLQWVGYGNPITDTNGAFGVALTDWMTLDNASGSTNFFVPSGGALSVTWGTGGGIWWDEDVSFPGLTDGENEAFSGCLYAAQGDFGCAAPISVTISGMNSVASGSYAFSLGGAVDQSAFTYTFNPATVTDANSNTYTLNFTAPVLYDGGSIASTTTNLTLSGDSMSFTICNDDGNDGLRAILSEMTVQYTPAPVPVITTSPLSQTAPENGNVTFTAAATGSALPLTYKWYFDGAPMTGQTNGTLNLTAVSDGSSGTYQVEVTDANGHFIMSSAATLVVAPAGSLVLYDASTMNYYFSVNSYSPGIANYFSVETGTSITIDQLGFDSGTNVLTDTVTVQLWDAVAGQVLATVTFGASDSPTPVGAPAVYLYLKAPTNAVMTGPGTYAIAQYGGTYANGPAGETINTGNGAIVEGDSRYWAGENGGPGALPYISDSPPYPHYLGPTLQYKVFGGPVITQQPAGGVFDPGATVTLSVGATGSLPLSYLWSKNNSSLGITTPTLTLTNVTVANAETYTVAVSNNMGVTISSPAVVTVAAAPVLNIQLNPGIVIQGTVGAPYQVQYSTAAAPTNWILLQNIPALPSSPYIVYDPTPISSAGGRSYRAVIE